MYQANLSSGQYYVNKNIRFKTSMLRSAFCDYSDAYVIVKGKIIVEGDNDAPGLTSVVKYL